MMRNDDVYDIDEIEIDLSQHRRSRLPGVLVIGAAVGVALIAAWVFTPILLSNGTATASLLPATKARPAAPDQPAEPILAAAQSTPAAPTAEPVPDAADEQTSSPGPAASPAPETTASTSWSPPPWPQSHGFRVAAVPAAAAAPPAENDTARLAAVAPQDTPAEPFDNVPLPRKRPSRLIAASLVIPLPRPRPEIESDAPAEQPSTFDLQVERMR